MYYNDNVYIVYKIKGGSMEESIIDLLSQLEVYVQQENITGIKNTLRALSEILRSELIRVKNTVN